MLVVLLLISQISCDWVEISQNHYKKEPPLRATHTPVNVRYEDKTTENRFFKNHTVNEKQWNKAIVDRVSNVGNIQRVQEPSVKTPSVKLGPTENVYRKSTEKIDLNDRLNTNSEHARLSIYNPFRVEDSKRIEEHRDIVTKFSNKKPVKMSPGINNANNRDIMEPLQDPVNRRKIVIEKLNQSPIKGSEENKIYREQESDKDYDEDDINNDNGKYVRNFQRISNNEQNKFPLLNNFRDKSNNFSFDSLPIATRTGETFGTQSIKDFHDIRNFDEDNIKEFSVNDYKFPNASITITPPFHGIGLHEMHSKNTDDRFSKLDLSSQSDLNTNNPVKSIINGGENIIDNLEQDSIVPKAQTLSGMWKMMKVVTDTIYKNTHRTFKSKIKYLESLKTSILTSIEEQVDNIWPDDVEHRGPKSRRARSAQARGHVEFPSSESTLMTISFLTFAVFLIKLVLQVIHTYKNKTMMVAPAVFAAVGRAAAAIRSQN